MSPEGSLTLCRFLHDAALLGLWGSFAFLAALVPRSLALRVSEPLTALRVAAIGLAAATVLLALPIETAAIGSGWGDALDPDILRAVLLDTSVGRSWLVQAGAEVLLAATLTMPARRRTVATALASGLALMALASTGHAAMNEGRLGIVHRLNDAVHLLAGGAWLGALVPLLPILRALNDPEDHGDAVLALRRFSSAGHVAVALVIATGVANTVLVLGRWPSDWSSPYQAMLAAKIALVLVMTLLALVNRYLFVPRMARARDASLRSLHRSTGAEILLGLTVVGLVAVFGMLEPN